MKVASIIKITTRRSLINWLDTLPVGITFKTYQMIMNEYPNKKYVIWTLEDGFIFY